MDQSKSKARLAKLFLLILFFLLVIGCGSNSTNTGAINVIKPVSLLSVQITPANPTIPLGLSEIFTVTGYYSDKTTKDLTTAVTWSSSDVTISDISRQADGVVTAKAKALGVTTITATLDSISASTTFTVTEAALLSIEIWPADLPIAVGAAQRFFANGRFSDNTSHDITDLVNWSTAESEIATVSPSEDGFTYLYGLSVGQTVVTASYAGKTASTTAYVLPIQTLSVGHSDLSYAQVGIDGAGNITTVWQYWFSNPAVFLSARYEKEKGWLPESNIATNATDDTSDNMVFNENGQGLMVWSSYLGSFYAYYSPVDGWQTPQAFISNDVWSTPIRIAIDASGNGLAAWSYAGKVFASQYDVAGAAWTLPIEQGAGTNPTLSANSNGDAVLIWENWDQGNTGKWIVFAALFAHQTGWQQPSILYTSNQSHTPTAAIDNQGRVVAIWIDNVTFQVLSSWYIPNQGWQPIQTLKTRIYPEDAKVAVDSLGNAMAIWADGYDKKVYANYYSVSQGWTGSIVIRDATAGYGDTIYHRIKMDAQGNAIALWLGDNLIEIKRFNRLYGWQEIELLGGLKSAGVYDFNFAMTSKGEAVIAWEEGYSLWNKQYTSYTNVEDLYIVAFPIF